MSLEQSTKDTKNLSTDKSSVEEMELLTHKYSTVHF